MIIFSMRATREGKVHNRKNDNRNSACERNNFEQRSIAPNKYVVLKQDNSSITEKMRKFGGKLKK